MNMFKLPPEKRENLKVVLTDVVGAENKEHKTPGHLCVYKPSMGITLSLPIFINHGFLANYPIY